MKRVKNLAGQSFFVPRKLEYPHVAGGDGLISLESVSLTDNVTDSRSCVSASHGVARQWILGFYEWLRAQLEAVWLSRFCPRYYQLTPSGWRIPAYSVVPPAYGRPLRCRPDGN